MNSREKALQELKKLIREQRDRIDPRLLEKAARAISGKTGDSKDVPFDRKSAAKAIDLFLKDHADSEGFARRLRDFMHTKEH